MTDHKLHPLTAVGTLFSALGAVVAQYLPMLVGFALTVVGIWLQSRENRRHERAMAAVRERPPRLYRPDVGSNN